MFRVFCVFRGSYLLQQLFGEAGWVTFRTETQRGTECTEGKCVKYLDLIYMLVPFNIARLRPEQRIKRGTASQFPAQRGTGATSHTETRRKQSTQRIYSWDILR